MLKNLIVAMAMVTMMTACNDECVTYCQVNCDKVDGCWYDFALTEEAVDECVEECVEAIDQVESAIGVEITDDECAEATETVQAMDCEEYMEGF